jgi:hypothetical protein
MIQRGFIFALIYIKLRVFKFGFDLNLIPTVLLLYNSGLSWRSMSLSLKFAAPNRGGE